MDSSAGSLDAVDWPDGKDHAPDLRSIVDLLAKAIRAADEIGRSFLAGRALAIWRNALLAGPPESLDATLENLKQDDGLDACVCIAWMPASALAASPRRFVRLVGLNSSRWPRGISEDRLISDHIVPTVELDPLPIGAADRRDFETILATTARQIVLSRARRDGEGRLLGRSSLAAAHADEKYIRRNEVPTHAFSESDRLMARPQDFAREPQAISATACWRNWHRKEITPHDGLIRTEHPLMLAILERTQSASSLRLLLRNPLAFVWSYGMHLGRLRRNGTAVLDPVGAALSTCCSSALQKLQAVVLTSSDEAQSRRPPRRGPRSRRHLGSEQAMPPALIWRRTLDDARTLTFAPSSMAMIGCHIPTTRSCVRPGGSRESAKSAPGIEDCRRNPGRGFASPGTSAVSTFQRPTGACP
jgi:hypothetical protein